MKKAIIHIGGHKTGTTAIQSFCVLNWSLLLDKDVLYPLELITDINTSGLQAHHGLVNFLLDNQPFWKSKDLKPQSISDIGEYLKSLPRDKNIILSSENLTWLNEKAVDDLKIFLEGYEVYMVLYVRRQDNALQALYQTAVIADGESRQFGEFEKSTRPAFEYYKIAKCWQQALGDTNIIIRVYEKEQLAQGDSIVDFFHVLAEILQIKIDIRSWRYSTGNVTNRGMPEHIIALIRYHNSLNTSDKIVPSIKKFASLIYSHSHGSYEIASPSQRNTLLESFAQSNQQLASEFLRRKNKLLFNELVIQQTDAEWDAKYNWNGAFLKLLIEDMLSALDQKA